MDPETGKIIDLASSVPESLEQADRLIAPKEDQEEAIRSRYTLWSECSQRVEDAFKKQILNIQGEDASDDITDLIADAILNPIV